MLPHDILQATVEHDDMRLVEFRRGVDGHMSTNFSSTKSSSERQADNVRDVQHTSRMTNVHLKLRRALSNPFHIGSEVGSSFVGKRVPFLAIYKVLNY